jgi:Fe-S cluster assembly ATP-binding protein
MPTKTNVNSSSEALFEVKNLKVQVDETLILKGINLKIMPGEVHALMGRNGSGKTTLSHTLMGHPAYEVIDGEVILSGELINDLEPDERAKRRLFLGFQYPTSIPGVTVANFLRASLKAVRGDEVPVKEMRKLIKAEIEALQIPEDFMNRFLNDGFSGGEKKRLETLQMRLLQPKMAILDETDSGLDVDALRLVSQQIESLRAPDRGILLITHYQRMLNYIKPDFVHILMNGEIVQSGGPELALKVEDIGYDWTTAASGTAGS